LRRLTGGAVVGALVPRFTQQLSAECPVRLVPSRAWWCVIASLFVHARRELLFFSRKGRLSGPRSAAEGRCGLMIDRRGRHHRPLLVAN